MGFGCSGFADCFFNCSVIVQQNLLSSLITTRDELVFVDLGSGSNPEVSTSTCLQGLDMMLISGLGPGPEPGFGQTQAHS